MAKEQGITESELGAVQSIVMAVAGGRPMMQFLDVQEKVNKRDALVDTDCGGTCS